jgi:hypothetical protein
LIQFAYLGLFEFQGHRANPPIERLRDGIPTEEVFI